MSTSTRVLEAENDPAQYEELYEDWFSNADFDLSSPSHSSLVRTASPGYLVIKRQTYPHWEKGLLKDEVIVKLHGRSEKSKAKSNVDHLRLTNAYPIRATDSAALAAPTGEEPNNVRASLGHDAHSQINAGFSNEPTPSTSFVPPLLPPATQFPPLDPRAQLLGLRPEGQHARIPTFSFARLQTMVSDSVSRSSVSESSILRHLAGLHNQVQGSPQSPSFWGLPFETGQKKKLESLKSSQSSGDVDEVDSFSVMAEDDYDGSLVDGWPRLKSETLAELRSIEHAFDDSFNPNCHSSTFSGSGVNARSRHEGHDAGFASGSECTCGHKKHYVRPLQHASSDDEGEASDVDDRRDFSFYFRPRTASRHGSNNVGNNSASDHVYSHARQYIRADTLSAIENYAGSESSMRANANTSVTNISLFAPSDSRTSSELYLSPNFPDTDDRHDYYATGISPEIYDARNDDASEESRDNHRVFFIEPAPPSPPSTLRKLFAATRKRVSSISGSAFSIASRKQTGPRPGYHSTPSAKENLEKNERLRSRKVSDVSGRPRRVLHKRGRSSTMRPLASSLVASHDVSLAVDPNEKQERKTKQERPKTRRTNGRFSFIGRFLHLGHGTENEKVKVGPDPFAAEGTTESYMPPAPSQASTQLQCGLRTGSEMLSIPASVLTERENDARSRQTLVPTQTRKEAQTHTRPRPRIQTDAAVLFRNFSLASPRTPGGGRRRSGTAREWT